MARLTQVEIAQDCDLSPPAVSKMLTDGVLPKIGSVGFATARDYRVFYIRRLREQAAGRMAADDGDEPDLVRERALLARAQREGHAMKNAVLRGELLPVDDVEATVGAVLDATRAKMLALPTKAAPQCVGLADLSAARDLLTRMVHDALSDLAATPIVVASAADRARRRIGRGAAGDTVDAEAEAAAAPDGQRVG